MPFGIQDWFDFRLILTFYDARLNDLLQSLNRARCWIHCRYTHIRYFKGKSCIRRRMEMSSAGTFTADEASIERRMNNRQRLIRKRDGKIEGWNEWSRKNAKVREKEGRQNKEIDTSWPSYFYVCIAVLSIFVYQQDNRNWEKVRDESESWKSQTLFLLDFFLFYSIFFFT